MVKKKIAKIKSLIDFLFEASVLKRLERTGWQILGANKESVAEHSFMVVIIAYILAKELDVNLEKILLMALFHDFSENRTGDVYKLADLYVQVDEKKAINDAFSSLNFGDDIIRLIAEYHKGKTIEAKIVHDADSLALCLELKQLIEQGNTNAKEWFDANLERLKLKCAQKIGQEVKSTNSQNWWKKERKIIHKSYNKK